VYWLALSSTARAVGRVPKSGGEPEILYEAQTTGVNGVARSLAVDEQAAYWADSMTGALWRVPKHGGQATTLVAGGFAPWGLAVSDGTLFFSDQSSGPPPPHGGLLPGLTHRSPSSSEPPLTLCP
jgi:sugar lactone lactonase YvrE